MKLMSHLQLNQSCIKIKQHATPVQFMREQLLKEKIIELKVEVEQFS